MVKEIQILPIGEWRGYINGRGEKETVNITPELIQSLISYFDAKKLDRPADYEHQTLSGQQAPASGWIKKLIDKGADGLWAVVDWTERAWEYITNKEYRWISPVIFYDAIDPESGERVEAMLHSIALTNDPFFERIGDLFKRIDAMKASMNASNMRACIGSNQIFTSHFFQGVNSMDINKVYEAIKKALQPFGLAAEATADDIVALVKKIAEFLKSLPGADTGVDEAIAETTDALGAETQMMKALGVTDRKSLLATLTNHLNFISDMHKLTGMSDTKGVIAKIGELKAGNSPDQFVAKSDFEDLQRRMQERDVNDLLAANSNRIPPADRQFYFDLAMRNFEDAKTIVAKLPEVISKKEIKTPEAQNLATLTDEEKLVCKAMGSKEEDFLRYKREQADAQ